MRAIRGELNAVAPKDSGLILEGNENENEKKKNFKKNERKFSEIPKAKSRKKVASGRVGIGAEMKRKAADINVSNSKPKIPKVKFVLIHYTLQMSIVV